MTALERLDVPAVLVDRQINRAHFSSVVIDHAGGIQAAIAHLAARATAGSSWSTTTAMFARFENVLTLPAQGVQGISGMRGSVRSAAPAPDPAYQAAREVLSGPETPTAMIAGSNQILVGVLRAIRELGFRSPTTSAL